MFFDPACIPCIVKQAYNSSKLFTNGDNQLQLKIIKEVCAEAQKIDEYFTAPLFSSVMQSIIEKYSGSDNPYRLVKETNLENAQQYIKFLETMIDASNDKLETSVRSAIVGNIIDFASNPDFDIESEINKIASNNINLSALPQFRNDCKKAKSILYIGDNYEEALFDKFLIKELVPQKVIFAVRSKPILNDITLEDAKYLGIDKLCKVIESGSVIAGTDIKNCTPEFLSIYDSADVVIAKGQGNYESLLNESRPIYFLFKVKCEVIAKRSGSKVGQGLLHYKN